MPRIDGGLAIGFPVRDMEAAVANGKAKGFETTAGITRLPMPRADGSMYDALETHFKAPDDVYVLGIGRPEDLAPVGPIAEGKNIGGPAYSSQTVNNGESDIAFYRDVLGYEVRRDLKMPVVEQLEGGLIDVPVGTVMRFYQLFAPGSSAGYLVFLDFEDNGLTNETKSRPLHRGLAAWTFPVADMADMLARLKDHGADIVAGPLEHDSPLFGKHRAVTVTSPNGFLIELIEARS